MRDTSFLDYLVKAKQGYIFGKNYSEPHRQEYLARLAHILYTAGIEKNHPLIKNIAHTDARFRYPPKNGVSYKKLLAMKATTRWSLKNLLAQHLERQVTITKLLKLSSYSYQIAHKMIVGLSQLERINQSSLEKKLSSADSSNGNLTNKN